MQHPATRLLAPLRADSIDHPRANRVPSLEATKPQGRWQERVDPPPRPRALRSATPLPDLTAKIVTAPGRLSFTSRAPSALAQGRNSSSFARARQRPRCVTAAPAPRPPTKLRGEPPSTPPLRRLARLPPSTSTPMASSAQDLRSRTTSTPAATYSSLTRAGEVSSPCRLVCVPSTL
ncbi:hypothetical protein DFH09DRAFT_1158506 [Mycena vulgaris]|nr:hypothetical protein DFH09DRAFT_1158506 [Mycena vulgaris]